MNILEQGTKNPSIWMRILLSAMEAKEDSVEYCRGGENTKTCPVPEDHVWNLADNEYFIRTPMTFAIRVYKDGSRPDIVEVNPQWTSSDFGDYGNHRLIAAKECSGHN